MARKGLNARQQQVLEFIRSFDEERSYPPTIRDIQQACSISSTSVVDYNLHILERMGYIRRDREVSRGIEVLGGGRDATAGTRISVLGYIAAGEPVPVPTQESWGDTAPLDVLDLPAGFLGKINRDTYALRVKGTSMVDALVDDGDVVIVQPVDSVQDGDMVVAWLQIEQEATLKRLYREGDRIRLQPANSTMKPIFVDPENIEVQGKVVAVIRNTV
ncbi:MAG: transcriptional repressor LexA [Dehalococcoidia bacterium]|nr:transcriptional repressor LexA [Dehalococcoidia bacterium]